MQGDKWSNACVFNRFILTNTCDENRLLAEFVIPNYGNWFWDHIGLYCWMVLSLSPELIDLHLQSKLKITNSVSRYFFSPEFQQETFPIVIKVTKICTGVFYFAHKLSFLKMRIFVFLTKAWFFNWEYENWIVRSCILLYSFWFEL